MIVAFIDEQRAQGRTVGSICRVLREQGLQVAARTYRTWRRGSRPVADRTMDDALVMDTVRDLAWTTDVKGRRRLTPEGLYGRRKMTALVRRRLPSATPGSVDRAMRAHDLSGIRRSKGLRTTIPAKDGKRAGDLLDRNFTAAAPNRTWVMDFTYVRAWSGWVYVAFVVDVYAQRIMAWHAASTKDVDLVMTPIRMATWQREREGHPVEPGQLIGHADAGSQGEIKRSSQHPRHGGVEWSVVSRRQIGGSGRSCGRLVIRSSSETSRLHSGPRSPRDCCRSKPRPWSAWRQPSGSDGSATLAACHRST